MRDQLVQAMREVIGEFYPAGPAASPDLARIVNERHFARLHALLRDALARGATLAHGGEVVPARGYIEPTILTDVPAGAAILEEEIFGPLLPVLTFATLPEAAAYVNARPRPLAQYVFSQNPAHQRYLLATVAAGGAALNETILQLAHPGLPFGGVGNSGLGKAHGHAGLLAFSNQKSVLRQRVGLTSLQLFYPPYTARTQRLLGWLLRYL